MKVGDLVSRTMASFTLIPAKTVSRVGIITRDLKCDRYMVLFFDDNSYYNIDKRLLELISEGR